MVTSSGILKTNVYHKRYSPSVYAFSHKVIYIALNLKDIKFLKTKFFSINRFNFFSLFWKNYGFETFKDPKLYIKGILEKFKIESAIVDDIVLVTMPKILGYAFNPVSFWLCFNSSKDLCFVLAEVNNTFGERHGYLCFHKNLRPITKEDVISRDKIFHVSPFCEVAGYYEFRFEVNFSKINIDINYFKNNEILISTSIKSKIIRLNDKNLIKYFIKLPIMLFKVMLLIHYHALRLWIKKVPYFKKPLKANTDIT